MNVHESLERVIRELILGMVRLVDYSNTFVGVFAEADSGYDKRSVIMIEWSGR